MSDEQRDFLEWAESAGIDPRSFTLDGDRDETLCLRALPGGDYAVYYSERGQLSGLRQFVDRAAALQALREMLLADESSRTEYWISHGAPPPGGPTN